MGIIRKIKKIVIGRNHGNSNTDNLGGTDEIHAETGPAIESFFIEETFSLQCGCFARPGGRCQECGKISCINCHQHCGGQDNLTSFGCGKPICREHSNYITLGQGINLPFCSQCRDKIKRKIRSKMIAGLFLAPFIEREANNER